MFYISCIDQIDPIIWNVFSQHLLFLQFIGQPEHIIKFYCSVPLFYIIIKNQCDDRKDSVIFSKAREILFTGQFPCMLTAPL